MTWLIEEMLKKFEHSPDIGKLLVTNLEVLLQADMRTEAKQFMEYCITGYKYEPCHNETCLCHMRTIKTQHLCCSLPR